MCYKAQNIAVRVAWFSAKFARAHPEITRNLVALTAAPTGKWKWMASKRTFVAEAGTHIVKSRLREPIAFLVDGGGRGPCTENHSQKKQATETIHGFEVKFRIVLLWGWAGVQGLALG